MRYSIKNTYVYDNMDKVHLDDTDIVVRLDELEEQLEKCKEFIKDCSVSHHETRYKYRAQVLLRQIK